MTPYKTLGRLPLIMAVLLPGPLAAQDAVSTATAAQALAPVVETVTAVTAQVPVAVTPPDSTLALPPTTATLDATAQSALQEGSAVVTQISGQVQGVASSLPGTTAVPGAALSPANPLDAVLQDIVGVVDAVGPRTPALQLPADDADLSIADRIVLGRCVMMSVDGMQLRFDGVPANEPTASHARERMVSVLCPEGRKFSLSTAPVVLSGADASRYNITLRPYESPEVQVPARVWAKVNGVPVAEHRFTADGTEQIITISFQIEDPQRQGMTPAKPGEIVETEALNRLYLIEQTQRDVVAGQAPALASGALR